MRITEILTTLFGWMSSVWGALRWSTLGAGDRQRFHIVSIPARIEAEKLKITIGRQDGGVKGRKPRHDATKTPKA
jgi:hypothetical protein